MDLGSAIITAGSNLLGSTLNVLSSSRNARKNYKYARKLQQEQNEYNSPVNQMQRLQEAGLNPNLVYGSGNITGNQQTSSPQLNLPTSVDYGIGDAASSYLNAKQRLADINAVNQSAKVSAAQVEHLNAQTAEQVLKNTYFAADRQLRNDALAASKNYAEAQIESLNLKSDMQRLHNEFFYTHGYLPGTGGQIGAAFGAAGAAGKGLLNLTKDAYNGVKNYFNKSSKISLDF